MNRKELQKLISDVAHADTFSLRSMLQFGFELETQETEGTHYDEWADGGGDGFNRSLFNEDAYAYFCSRVKADAGSWRDRIAQIMDVQPAMVTLMDDALRLADYDVQAVYDTMVGRARNVRGAAIRLIETGNFRDKPRHGDDKYRSGLARLNRDLISIKSDGSVRGFEFTTSGPVSYGGAMQAASQLYKLQHEIDANCSFHVHVSVPGVQHIYGSNMQRHMVEYILENCDRLPAGMKDRFNNDEAYSYFRTELSTEKYTAVHFNSRCGSWEFRLFGNIQTLRDAKRCLDLAAEAIQYAYQMKLSKEVSETQKNWVEDGAWNRLMKRSMQQGIKPLTFLRNKEHLRSA